MWPISDRGEANGRPGSEMRREEMIRRLSILPLAAFLLLFSSVQALRGETEKKKEAENGSSPRGFVLFETGRTLSLVSLVNRTDDPSLDYLSGGMLKMVQGKLEAITYIPEAYPGVVFRASPLSAGTKNVEVGPEGRRLLLHVERPRLSEKQSELNRKGEAARLALSLGASYLLYGSFSYADDSRTSLKFELILYDALYSREERFRHVAPLREVYRGTEDLSRSIASRFRPPRMAKIRIETDEPGALLYLDDRYLGRSPFDGEALPGDYRLVVEQDNHRPYSRPVTLKEGASLNLKVELSDLTYSSELRVESEPEGADVYLNARYLGKAPLDAKDLPPGTHRLRLSHEGYIDRLVGVVLKEGKKKEVRLSMKEGDTLFHYRDPNYAFFDWTYHDLSFYSMISSIGFYSGWWYWRVQADRVEDSIRPMVPGLAISDIPEWNFYQYHLIQQNGTKVRLYRRYADISAGGGVGALILAGLFLWKGITLDEREAGEVVFNFTTPLTPGGIQKGAGGGISGGYSFSTGVVPAGLSLPYDSTGARRGLSDSLVPFRRDQYRVGFTLFF